MRSLVAPGNQGTYLQTGLVSGSAAIARVFQAKVLGVQEVQKLSKGAGIAILIVLGYYILPRVKF